MEKDSRWDAEIMQPFMGNIFSLNHAGFRGVPAGPL